MSETAPERTRPRLLKGLLALVLLALALLAERNLHLSAYLSPERIEAWLAAAGAFAPLVFMGVMAAAVVVSPIPSLPLDVAAGSFFGPWLGTLYAAAGALGGAVLSFLIARLLGRELLERFLRGHIAFCRSCSDHLLTRMVFVSRLLPVISFDVVSYGAGLTKMSLSRFSLATLLGMLAPTFVFVAFGHAIVMNPWLTAGIGIGVVAVFFLLPRWIERYNFLGLRALFQHGES